MPSVAAPLLVIVALSAAADAWWVPSIPKIPKIELPKIPAIPDITQYIIEDKINDIYEKVDDAVKDVIQNLEDAVPDPSTVLGDALDTIGEHGIIDGGAKLLQDGADLIGDENLQALYAKAPGLKALEQSARNALKPFINGDMDQQACADMCNAVGMKALFTFNPVVAAASYALCPPVCEKIAEELRGAKKDDSTSHVPQTLTDSVDNDGIECIIQEMIVKEIGRNKKIESMNRKITALLQKQK